MTLQKHNKSKMRTHKNTHKKKQNIRESTICQSRSKTIEGMTALG